MHEEFEVPGHLQELDWTVRLDDPGTGNWKDKWFVDGERAEIRNTPRGMVFSAGPVPYDNGCHAVLWTKDTFSRNVKFECTYTRLDSATRFVNILYLQATGSEVGPYEEDIRTWADRRLVPYMKTYFQNMDLLHLSFAAFENTDDTDEDYVRVRRYPTPKGKSFSDTQLEPSYSSTGLFRPGVPYGLTLIKTDDDLYFEVTGENTHRVFHWDLSSLSPLRPGRIGIRHMWTRSALYQGVRISTAL